MTQLSFGDPIVAQLERERKQTHARIRQLWRRAGLGLLVMSLLTVYTYIQYQQEGEQHYWLFGVGAMVLGVVTTLIAVMVIANRFKQKFQFKVLPLVAEQVWPEVRWEPNGLLPMEELRAAELVAQHQSIDEYDGKNLFSGTVAGLPVQLSEVTASEEKVKLEDGKPKTYYESLYRGILLVAERFGHPGYTKITYRAPGWGLNVNLPGWFGGMSSRPEIQLETNDPVLGQRFTLESDEPEAGRALITEELLVVLQKLKNSGKGTPTVVLTPLKLYVALSGEDFSLSPDYKKPIHQQVTLSHAHDELQYLLRVVELLSEEPTR